MIVQSRIYYEWHRLVQARLDKKQQAADVTVYVWVRGLITNNMIMRQNTVRERNVYKSTDHDRDYVRNGPEVRNTKNLQPEHSGPLGACESLALNSLD